MNKLILITGGARSGKSSYALHAAEKIGEKKLFVATSPTLDDEMTARITRHQDERRDRGWDLLEEQVDLCSHLIGINGKYDVILVDCITLWVNNIIYTYTKQNRQFDDIILKSECQKMLKVIQQLTCTVICVTNEVGLGIVPENKVSRLYRDCVGMCNQTIATAADDVILVSCGIPLYLKQEPKPA